MYHINRNGTTSGPYTEPVFFQMLSSGQILPTDLVWREGEPDWRPASEYPGLARPGGPPPMPGAQDPYAPSPYRPPSSPVFASAHHGPTPPTYLTQAILVTVLCCIPFGIPAIVNAASVSGKIQAGDYAGAKVASDRARFWCWMGFGFGLGVSVIYGVLIATGNIRP